MAPYSQDMEPPANPGRFKSILKSNRDRLPEQLELQAELPQNHENIRGPRNYH